MVNSVFRAVKAAALLLNLLQEGKKKICIFPFSLEKEASSPENRAFLLQKHWGEMMRK